MRSQESILVLIDYMQQIEVMKGLRFNN